MIRKMASAGGCRYLLLLLLLNCSLINLSLSSKSTPPSAKTLGQPWPMPAVYATTGQTLWLTSSSFKFIAGRQSCDILQAAFNRYFKYIFYAGKERSPPQRLGLQAKGQPMLTTLRVDVDSPCREGQYPALGMDESYDLVVKGDPAVLNASTVWGALRGLETFSQLIYEDPLDLFVVNVTKIQDRPRFAWRGVLLDTSRHYLAKEIIFQNLEAMAFNKMNVFHWHVVDDQSFPYQSRLYPELSDKGAYNPYTHIYSQQDVKEIIEFARQRGIRVVPEFDSPGHTQSWGNGRSNLLTKCYKHGQPTGSFGPIDPTLSSTYQFLKGFFMELAEVFKDSYLHLGGDEVPFGCWKSNPNITQFMQRMGFGTNYAKLEGHYMQNLLDIVNTFKRSSVVWQEVFDNGVKVPMDVVVDVWKLPFPSEMYNVTKSGLHTILSAPWYLDMISYGADWKDFYKAEPLHFNGSHQQEALVIGGEASLWGEFVDNTNVESRLWPRASAVAERLWSPPMVNNITEAEPRLEAQRCRLIRRGINAEPASGPGYCSYEAPAYITTLKERWRQL